MAGGRKEREIQGAWGGIGGARVISRFFLKKNVFLRRVAQFAGATRAVYTALYIQLCEQLRNSRLKHFQGIHTHKHTHTHTHTHDIAFLCMHLFGRVAELAHDLGCAAEEKKNMNGRMRKALGV